MVPVKLLAWATVTVSHNTTMLGSLETFILLFHLRQISQWPDCNSFATEEARKDQIFLLGQLIEVLAPSVLRSFHMNNFSPYQNNKFNHGR